MAQKSVLITGCSEGGIGDGLAQEFLKLGLRVFATARDLTKVEHLKALGCIIVKLDVCDDESVKTAAKRVAEKTGGGLDILVNNAGLGEPSENDIAHLFKTFHVNTDWMIVYCSTVLDIDIPTARRMFETNVFGSVLCTQVFSPLLLQSHGMIVNIGSMTPLISGPFCSMYASSKAALELVSHATRIECEPLGLHVIHVLSLFSSPISYRRAR